jgi:NitT/TauT family transport system substrate-binding protein
VRIVPNPTSLALFLRDERFAQQAYSFSEPHLARREGADPVCLMVSDLGFNPYTSALLVNGRTTREQPELVRKFVAASVRGWDKYLEDPEAPNRHIHEKNPKMDLETLAFGAEALRPLCFGDAPGEVALGSMTRERWQTLTEQLIEVGALKPGAADPDEAFTTKFLAD